MTEHDAEAQSAGPSVVEIRLPEALSADARGSRVLEWGLSASATLSDVLLGVAQEYPALYRRVCDETGQVRRFVNVYIGDDECRTLLGLATPVTPGTVIHIIGSVAGG